MQREWFQKKVTVEEIEVKHTPESSERRRLAELHDAKLKPIPMVPFGFINDQWVELKAQAQEGDEWWFFSSPQEDWNALAGREGYSLVRLGEIIGSICSRFS